MTYIKIGDQQYPAAVRGYRRDTDWGDRDSIAFTIDMTYEEAVAVFVDGLDWATAYQEGDNLDVRDRSDYSVAGPITDNRDGTVTVKMGKITAEEALAELMEVLA